MSFIRGLWLIRIIFVKLNCVRYLVDQINISQTEDFGQNNIDRQFRRKKNVSKSK